MYFVFNTNNSINNNIIIFQEVTAGIAGIACLFCDYPDPNLINAIK